MSEPHNRRIEELRLGEGDRTMDVVTYADGGATVFVCDNGVQGQSFDLTPAMVQQFIDCLSRSGAARETMADWKENA